jgi:hypothetical protein
VTYLDQVHGMMAALKRKLPRNRGAIVQLGSALAYRPIPLQSAYCSAKHAVKSLPNLYVASYCTWALMCILQSCSCQRSTRRSSTGAKPVLRDGRSLWRRYSSLRSPGAIVWAAHHCRHYLYVGLSSVFAIWVNQCITGLLDRYLAHITYRGNQGTRTGQSGSSEPLMANSEE